MLIDDDSIVQVAEKPPQKPVRKIVTPIPACKTIKKTTNSVVNTNKSKICVKKAQNTNEKTGPSLNPFNKMMEASKANGPYNSTFINGVVDKEPVKELKDL